jgi:RNA polymerase sigma-70 factor (ECF subfamily)
MGLAPGVLIYCTASSCRYRALTFRPLQPSITVSLVDGSVSASTGHDYERLFREDGPTLWRTIYAYSGGSRSVADDAVAEAFARALEHRDSIRDPVPWLYRTALRLAGADMKVAAGLAPLVRERATEDQPELGGLMNALGALSPKQRAAVVLHYHADLPIKEVSRLMGSSVAAVKVHLHRGRKRLRELLGAEEVPDA